MSKLYICVRDDVPDYITPTLVAHATLRHHLECNTDEGYVSWLLDSFKKCVVRVNAKEFEKIRALKDTHNLGVVESWENKTLGGEVSCLTVVVDDDLIPNVIRFSKLWRPKEGANE